jgi:hypothetical protein
MLDTKEPFEDSECRRRDYALMELRSYCRTNAALRSFEKFERQLRQQLEKGAEGQSKPAQTPLIRSAEDFVPDANPNSECKPRFGWRARQGQVSNIAIEAVDLENAIDSKQTPMMSKSKTTSNIASMLDQEKNMKAAPMTSASGMGDANSLPQSTRQRPTVHEAQAQAKRVREQGVVAKTVVYRGASDQERRFGTTSSGGSNGAATNNGDAVGTDVSGSRRGNELISLDARLAANGGYCRKTSWTESLKLKKVLSDSMNGMRKIKRSFTRSGSASGSEKLIR